MCVGYKSSVTDESFKLQEQVDQPFEMKVVLQFWIWERERRDRIDWQKELKK